MWYNMHGNEENVYQVTFSLVLSSESHFRAFYGLLECSRFIFTCWGASQESVVGLVLPQSLNLNSPGKLQVRVS